MRTGTTTMAGLRLLAIAAVATQAFWLPLQSVAHAQQSTGPRVQQTPLVTNLWAGTSFQTRCTWPYRNQLPPCMSTWPEGDPNYHGSRSGPTFNR